MLTLYAIQTDKLDEESLTSDLESLKKQAKAMGSLGKGDVKILKFDLNPETAVVIETFAMKKGMAGINPNLTASKSVSVTDNIDPYIRHRHDEDQKAAKIEMEKVMSEKDKDEPAAAGKK